MRRVRALIGVMTVGLTATTAAAQTIVTHDFESARAGIRLGTSGRGFDVAGSLDSRLLSNVFRFRADVGVGRWARWGESPLPDPTVARGAALALLYIPFAGADGMRQYFGAGIAGFLPVGSDLRTEVGRRYVVGLEGSGVRWTFGVEAELDLPNERDTLRSRPRDDLKFGLRAGVAIRRRL